jgi:hypothetical protein
MQEYGKIGRWTRPVILGLLALFVSVSTGFRTATAAPSEAEAAICAQATAATEVDQGLPTLILGAISLAETGRWDAARKASYAWPWTVTSGDDARYLATKAEAIAVVKAMQARGVTNIDVGCMQINLAYHPDAFTSLDQAFDPMANAAYAGVFIGQLQDQFRSWSRSIATYHSSTRKFGLPYLKRVQRLWMTERRRVNELERDKRMETYEAQKAALAEIVSSVVKVEVLPAN